MVWYMLCHITSVVKLVYLLQELYLVSIHRAIHGHAQLFMVLFAFRGYVHLDLQLCNCSSATPRLHSCSGFLESGI